MVSLRRKGVACAAAGLIAASVLAGCRSGGNAGPLAGLGRSPHERTDSLLIQTSPAQRTAAANAPIDARVAPAVIELTFDLVRVEFPVDERHPARKMWNHLDEMRTGAADATSLARNGLRAGVGSPGTWPAIQTIIESGGGIARREQLIAARGQPLALDLGPVSEGASVFAFDRSGRLSGKTFDTGRYVLIVDYLFRGDASALLDVQVALEIRDDHGVMTWEREGAIIRQVPSIDRHTFDGARFRATLSPDEFLAVGADGDPSGSYLVGNQFFLTTRDGQPIETMLMLTPKIVSSIAADGAAGRR